MPVTLKSIAQISGVSIGTVDRVMHNREGVNKETRDRVQKVAAELGYRSNLIGKALVAQRRPLRIGAIVNAPEFNYFAAEVLRGIETGGAEIEDFGAAVISYPMTAVSEAMQLELLEKARQDRVNGLIIKPVDSDAVRRALNAFEADGVPVITCTSDILGSSRRCFVGHDHVHEGRMMGSILAKTTPPRPNIAVITGSMNVLGHRRKIEGLTAALHEKKPEAQLLGVFETNNNISVAVAIVNGLLAKDTIDALCIQSMDQNGILRICECFTRQHPLITAFGTHEELEPLLKKRIVDFAVEENPYAQGYLAIRTMFDVLFAGAKIKKSFLEVDTRIVIDESYPHD